MATPPSTPSHIDFDDREQIVRLALASLFTSIVIARGDEVNTELAARCVRCVDALIDVVAAHQVKP